MKTNKKKMTRNFAATSQIEQRQERDSCENGKFAILEVISVMGIGVKRKRRRKHHPSC